MHEFPTHPVFQHIQDHAHIRHEDYQKLYQESIESPDTFWKKMSDQFLCWQHPWKTRHQATFSQGKVQWFAGGKLNVSENCIDQHLKDRANQVAIIWESNDPNQSTCITYQELHQQVCMLANALKAKGIQKGDRVCIYMPMIPQAAFAMLACARIGAVHSVVFGGFSPESLKDRINDANCCAVITADEGVRGNKTVPLKDNVDLALQHTPQVHTVFVVEHTGGNIQWDDARDVWYHQIVAQQSPSCPAEPMNSEDPLFILYTSGSTGKPKGVLHTSAGYLLQAAMTHKYVFDYQEGEVYWCTADVGWITGHSYIVYGPLANGATTLMFEGVPNYPDAGRFWQVIDKHKVNIFYTAPTAIRMLMSLGQDPVKASSRQSLRILGTVGEPINPEAWEWYFNIVGDSKCPVIDTWWQTETGAIMLAPLPGATILKPGSATLPFFGIVPALLDHEGREIEGPGEGYLMIKQSWPSQIRTVYGDHDRLIETYFKQHSGYYFTGDGAKRDQDGYYWITGRIDDVLNVSGHRIGTAEVESALVLNDHVAEAAVVGFPHPIKGEGIYAYVSLMKFASPNAELEKELIQLVQQEIGPIAKPDIIHWTPDLPKTRSGKIMRRILRKIAHDQIEELGDTSTLADPTVVEAIIHQHKALTSQSS